MDRFHFGTEHFGKRSKLLLEEYNNFLDKATSKTAWQDKTIAMMEAYHYFTDLWFALLQ